MFVGFITEMPLTAEDLQHLNAAQGFVELGLYLDANDELERISPEARTATEVLKVRVAIYRALKKWELLEVVARQLTNGEPDSEEWILVLGEAVRYGGSPASAKAILLKALEEKPNSAALHYACACLECVLGDLMVARVRLETAFKLSPEMRLRALDEPDLEAIWEML